MRNGTLHPTGKVEINGNQVSLFGRDGKIMTRKQFIGQAKTEEDRKDYNKYFDYNLLVVGSTHAIHVMEHVPKHWGIVSVELIKDKMDFYEIRDPQKSTKTTLKNQLPLLWRRELAQIQQINKLHKYTGKSKSFIEEYVLSSVPPEVLKRQVIDILFERDYSIFS